MYDLLPLSEQKWVRVDKQSIDFLPGEACEDRVDFALATLVNSKFPPTLAAAHYMQAAAHSLGLQLTVLDASTEGDPEQVKFIQGDTDAVAFGMGTGGSRSTTMSGGAIVMVSEKIVAKGKKLAAHILEAAEDDIEFARPGPRHRADADAGGPPRCHALQDAADLHLRQRAVPGKPRPHYEACRLEGFRGAAPGGR